MNIAELLAPLESRGVSWSVCAMDLAEPRRTILAHDVDLELPSASTAKLLLLLEVASSLASGEVEALEMVDRTSVQPVRDSGLWQHLATDTLPIVDAARLVGTVSDNWATNVLLKRFGGVGQIASLATSLDIRGVHLHDYVRDVRTAEDPATLSTGSSRGYVELLRRIATDDGIAPVVAALVREWLRDGVDLSMVASAFGLDPISHSLPDRGFTIMNKTGTDVGTRVDAGIATGPAGGIAYACIARWGEATSSVDPRDEVLAVMREIGVLLRTRVSD